MVKIPTVTSWQDLPVGCVVPGGTMIINKTGAWKVFRPVVDHKKCTLCMLCWIYCPDSSVVLAEGKIEFDYDHCKGCGICANECPAKAIRMELEV